MPMTALGGIHHVTAIAGDPQRNLDFYAGILGLRLLKVTVNFDDHGTYHLYYGDAAGSPGTIMTFFPWPTAPQGKPGVGQLTVTAFAVPEGSLDYWRQRLADHQVAWDKPTTRFGAEVLSFVDHDGLQLELVATPPAAATIGGTTPWPDGGVPGEHAIRAFHAVTMLYRDAGPSADFFTTSLGYEQVDAEGGRIRLQTPVGGPGSIVDLVSDPTGTPGRIAAGTVHHVAWRTPNDDTQLAWHRRISELGFGVSPVKDRQYFHSIYFQEPGGVRFEIATDPPGFGIDETPAELGGSLKLPPFLEPQRTDIEGRLPKLQLPNGGTTP